MSLYFSAGVYAFGLFTTDIFVSTGQLVTGSLAPYFLSVCQPNYTALGCQDTMNFVSQSDACSGDADDIIRARKTFPSKEAALSLYTAVYLAVSHFKGPWMNKTEILIHDCRMSASPCYIGFVS